MNRSTDLGGRQTDPPVVAFGGGTGMSCLLVGLKHHTSRITAVVTVSDDGGSSGRLRKEFDMVPPGDIRSCLLALAEGEPLIARLLDYRFEESDLAGHSLGNLFITALTRITGSFDSAVRELNRLLKVRGKVLPATGQKVSLIARHVDGTKSTGEMQISKARKPIERVELRPRIGPVADDIATAIEEAQLLLFGPGSLFTSVIPSLLVPGIRDRILANPAPKVYIANIMTQPGETIGLDLPAHIDALEAHVGKPFITDVVVHDHAIPRSLLDRYAAQGAGPVSLELETLRERGLRTLAGDLLDRDATPVRHDPDRLAGLIFRSFFSGLSLKTA